jgi:nitrogen fixation-related uncharacterized protein
MKAKLKLSRGLIGLGGLLLIAAPSSALAHDNLGGDELAVANWMLIAAIVVIVMGVLAGIWAAKTGQFTNVEESKYRMLDNADDFDTIMAEAEARAAAAAAAAAATAQTKAKSEAVQAQPAGAASRSVATSSPLPD